MKGWLTVYLGTIHIQSNLVVRNKLVLSICKFKKLTCKILERSCHVPACRLDARGWPQGGGSLDRGHASVHQHGHRHRPHRVGRESGRQTCETLQKSIKKTPNVLFIIFCKFIIKGQTISKENYGFLNSPKNQDSDIRSFFGRIEETIICFRDCLTFIKLTVSYIF